MEVYGGGLRWRFTVEMERRAQVEGRVAVTAEIAATVMAMYTMMVMMMVMYNTDRPNRFPLL